MLPLEVLRPRWPKDIAAVRRVLPEYLQAAVPPAQARNGSWVVRAKAGGTTIGFAWSVPMAGVPDSALVEEVAVVEEHKGRGIGSALVVASAAWMGELGFVRVSICPISGAGWVARLGFVDLTNTGVYEADIERVVEAPR